MDKERRYEYVITGGGLAGGLVALALATRRPTARVALVEQGTRLGGNHTWSFHRTDLPPDTAAWIEPLVAYRWNDHEVRFPSGARTLSGGYASISSSRFAEVVTARLEDAGTHLLCGHAVVGVAAHTVQLGNGRVLHGDVVIDARGPQPVAPDRSHRQGYQKFLGLEVELHRDSELARPVLMDATVPQIDGYRFVYTLPLGPRHLLVEDTYYSDAPALDRATVRERILADLRARGHRTVRVLREESGVLPLPWSAPATPPCASPFAIGYRGGWFHPVTGYSLPVATAVALAIAEATGPDDVAIRLGRLWRRHASQARFCHLLNRLMFRAVPPDQRWRLLARFYRLPAATIERFYALRLTLADRWRLLLGAPPEGFSLRTALFVKEVP
jgi:lycopene beta-cyclase